MILNSICRDPNLIPVQYLENRILEEVTYYEFSLRKFMNEYLACDWVTDHYLSRRAKGILCRELVVLSGVSSDIKTMKWRSRLSQPSIISLTSLLTDPGWLTHTCCLLYLMLSHWFWIPRPCLTLTCTTLQVVIMVLCRVNGRDSLWSYPDWWTFL